MADVTGAGVRAADMRGADLGSAIFLSQARLDAASGDARNTVAVPADSPDALVGCSNLDDGGRHENERHTTL